MNFEYKVEEDNLIIFFKPIMGNKKQYKIKRNNKNQKAVVTKTATTDMRDFIGNVKLIEDDHIVVRGVCRGKMRDVKAKCLYKPKIGERVMVTEHVNVKGFMENLATQKRILHGDMNFLNIGWSNSTLFNHLRIDIYTGEFIEIEGVAVPRT